LYFNDLLLQYVPQQLGPPQPASQPTPFLHNAHTSYVAQPATYPPAQLSPYGQPGNVMMPMPNKFPVPTPNAFPTPTPNAFPATTPNAFPVPTPNAFPAPTTNAFPATTPNAFPVPTSNAFTTPSFVTQNLSQQSQSVGGLPTGKVLYAVINEQILSSLPPMVWLELYAFLPI
jgi:hypothetical protein